MLVPESRVLRRRANHWICFITWEPVKNRWNRTLYASARSGWCSECDAKAFEIVEGDGPKTDGACMRVLLDAIMETISAPSVRCYAEGVGNEEEPKPAQVFASQPFSIAATTIGQDQYLGRACTGRIYSGKIELNDTVTLLRRSDGSGDTNPASAGGEVPQSKTSGLYIDRGVSRAPLDPPIAVAGDMVTYIRRRQRSTSSR